MITVSIYYKFIEGPWGGTNQFLKALKEEFMKEGAYERNPEKADVILFNSYPFRTEYFFNQIFKLKQKYPEKIIFYRLNGPISLYRSKDKAIDKIIALFNNLFADGIIFQSNWCREQNKKLFEISSKHEAVVHNAPDDEIFNKIGRKEFNPKEKIKLIASSWSSNWQKGFEVYKFLDENLDFSKYEMTFAGNSPIEFKNIKWIKPVSSEKLAEIFKKNDIYITASKNDPCSNSLIEALSCGLPAVALNDGGHPELVGEGGKLFNNEKDVIEKIEKVAQNFHYYQPRIPEFSIEKVAQKYYEFAKRICDDVQSKKHQAKQVNFSTKTNFYKMKLIILKWKFSNKLRAVLELAG